MALYPSQPTPEEKALKRIYIRLLEKRKQLRRTNEKAVQLVAPKPSSKELLTPKDAKEAAKRLITSGRVSLGKKSPNKRSGFKRVGEVSGQAPATKKPAKVTESASLKPKIQAADQKALYNRFVKAAHLSDDLERIPKRQTNAGSASTSSGGLDGDKCNMKECTICIHCHPPCVGEENLKAAFKRFGVIRHITADNPHKNAAFITFATPSIAAKAQKEMDKGMIRGSEVSVEAASKENGYIELPPDAEKHVWVQIAAGKDSPAKSSHKHKQRITTYDEPEF